MDDGKLDDDTTGTWQQYRIKLNMIRSQRTRNASYKLSPALTDQPNQVIKVGWTNQCTVQELAKLHAADLRAAAYSAWMF